MSPYVDRSADEPVAWSQQPNVARALRPRAQPEIAASYATLKRDLAATHECDRERYTVGKAGFIARILEQYRQCP
jgi:GrpB-like predicted nucleotidyltransferase (UPF0157 family)